MKLLEDRIRKEGIVFPGNILNVGAFLNQQVDIALYKELGLEWKRRFEGVPVTKIMTIEASGIGLACITALYFDVPVIFARKFKGKNVDTDVWITEVASFTHGVDYPVTIPKKYITPNDSILIIDDFLANGCALEGLTKIVQMAGAKVAGVGIAIEKGFQQGGVKLRKSGLKIESLAIIDSMSVEGDFVFRTNVRANV